MTVAFKDWVKACQQRVEKAAENNLPQEALIPQKLHSAMRYSVIGGGKRVRPLLVYAVGQIFDADPENLDLTALAVECVHSYSLIHDDLPCMDNDILRHGKPTTHAAFGEAVAMLAGDALQPEAFLFLVRTKLPAEQRIKLLELLAYASSTRGMCGGQAIDLSVVGNQKMTIEELRLMHSMKTGRSLRPPYFWVRLPEKRLLHSTIFRSLRFMEMLSVWLSKSSMTFWMSSAIRLSLVKQPVRML